MKKEKPHGKGRFFNLDIYYYEGDFNEGHQEGEGKYVNLTTFEEYAG